MMSKKKSIKKTITAKDRFRVNKGFKSKLRRIQINALQKKETREESDAVHDMVLENRKFYLDSIIVKTMKGRKTLKHNDLVAEVLRMTRFPCEMDTINDRIKRLISGGYMNLDEGDTKLYHYQA